jgi:hypothetical protein
VENQVYIFKCGGYSPAIGFHTLCGDIASLVAIYRKSSIIGIREVLEPAENLYSFKHHTEESWTLHDA